MQVTIGHKVRNIAQSVLLLAAMAAIAWVSLAVLGGPVFAAFASVGVIAGLLMAPRLPKRLQLAAYRALPLSEHQFPDGIRMLDALSRRAGLPVRPDLYHLPSAVPGAFALGSPTDSAVCISDGLLRVLDRRELAGVLAHEVSHIASRDLWIMGLADTITRATSLASYAGQILLIVNIPLLLIGAATIPWYLPILLILAPTITGLLQLALSRAREFDADIGAAELTGDPGALARALLKMERLTGRFWEEILLPGRRIPVPSLLRTHPSTEARVERLKTLAPRRRHDDFGGPDGRPEVTAIPGPIRRRPRLHWTGAYY